MRTILILNVDIPETDKPSIMVGEADIPIGVVPIKTITGDDALDIYNKLTKKEND